MARPSWRVSRNGRSRRSPNCWTVPVKDVRIRPAAAEDFTFLATMLGESAVWRPDKPTPTGDQVLADPRYAMYLAGWPRQGDYGLIAEQDGSVGAAWYRTFTEASHGYGFVAEDVPELLCPQLINATRTPIGEHSVPSIGRCCGGSVLGGGQADDLGHARGGCAGQADRQASGTTELVVAKVHR